MKQYIEASPRARQWLFLIAVLWLGLVLFASEFNTYFPLSHRTEELLNQIDARAWYALIGLCLFYLALSVVAVILAIGAVRTRQWPPAGVAVPFRMPVQAIRKPFKVWLLLGALLVAYAAHIVVAAYSAAATHSLTQETRRLLEPKS